MNKDIVFDNAWNAIEGGFKVWDLQLKMGQISFNVTRKFFMGRYETYKVLLENPDIPFDGNLISTVEYVDPTTKAIISTKRQLNRLYFMPVLMSIKGFNPVSLYIVGILSIEIDRKHIYNL